MNFTSPARSNPGGVFFCTKYSQNAEMTNRLYYGDNLDVLREHLGDESVDLIYLDPPFNSNASYNILFKSPAGAGADASIEAFDDTWAWGPTASSALMDITQSGNHKLHVLMQAMKTAIGENAMMAYLAMMAVRLVELHRVLKPTGSLYLHCDPTASHYLKLVLDAVFGAANYRNEIVWKRQSAHSDAKHKFSDVSDIIFFYAKVLRLFFYPSMRRMMKAIRTNSIGLTIMMGAVDTDMAMQLVQTHDPI